MRACDVFVYCVLIGCLFSQKPQVDVGHVALARDTEGITAAWVVHIHNNLTITSPETQLQDLRTRTNRSWPDTGVMHFCEALHQVILYLQTHPKWFTQLFFFFTTGTITALGLNLLPFDLLTRNAHFFTCNIKLVSIGSLFCPRTATSWLTCKETNFFRFVITCHFGAVLYHIKKPALDKLN